MRICVLGTGYVGLATVVYLASLGNQVCCIDSDTGKIEGLLEGRIPIFEPGLEAVLQEQVQARRLTFSTDLSLILDDCESCFIAVGTPLGRDGEVDSSQVMAAVHQFGRLINRSVVLVIKSTVPPGTTEKVKGIIREELIGRGRKDLEIDVVYNPEFLREGEALGDMANPDRIILGTDSQLAVEYLQTLYASHIAAGIPLLEMDSLSAEMCKYACNVMLACRISLMNELAEICDAVGADICEVQRGMALDQRIGRQYLNPGIGYGGSCLPKDVTAITKLGQQYGLPMFIASGIHLVNQRQRLGFADLITARFGNDLKGIALGVWGLSFKPGTDDLREAPALDIITALLERGASVEAFDPAANSDQTWPDPLRMGFKRVDSMREAALGKNALLLLTEWPCFADVDFSELSALMRERIIFDGRSLYCPDIVRRHGFEYYCIGRNSRPDSRS
ncbi:MAG: UDP-glucose/GDP-mannose dehydrogenase family protein [Syntrophomonadaceae bacterium]|nr:UDP-glucose/GDP-mannose dehydrogenase family protein [Syntrophomonadaceae bacterium]